MELIVRYTNWRRSFKFSPDRRFVSVYLDGRLSGFIWNCSKIIVIDGEKHVSSEFFAGI